MNKLQELDNLIEQIINNKPRGVEVVVEKGRSRTKAVRATDAIPAVPYPKLQLTNDWGQNPQDGFDVELFRLAGLGDGQTITERLGKLYNLVDCQADCPTRIQEIIARLSVMEMFSSMMSNYAEQSKGLLFENFLALCLRGTTVGGQVIQDLEIMSTDETNLQSPVSLKLLREGGAVKGSIKNLYDLVVNQGRTITYIVGYKKGKVVSLRTMFIDREFFETEIIAVKNDLTLAKVLQSGKNQFYINDKVLLGKSTPLGEIPIYSYKQMKNKAEQLTAALNSPVTKIYENLNLFSQQLTEFYLSNDVRNGRKARATFDKLTEAVNQEEKLDKNA